MNTACWIPDLFMKRVEARGHRTLFRSSEVPDLHELYGRAFEARYEEYERCAEAGEIFEERIPALDLWKQVLQLFETGHPWITFKDACNARSPQDHAGVIHSSNLCTEITLNTSVEETAVCNLGAIVLDRHLTDDGSIDHEALRATVRVAVRALDDVIYAGYEGDEPHVPPRMARGSQDDVLPANARRVGDREGDRHGVLNRRGTPRRGVRGVPVTRSSSRG
jgi:ribonucleoside-diphosphate reductase alpha chain